MPLALSHFKNSLKSAVSSGASIKGSSHRFDGRETFSSRSAPPSLPVVGCLAERLDYDY
jgi:hypothetical protein